MYAPTTFTIRDEEKEFLKNLEDLVKNFNLNFSTLKREFSAMSQSRSNSPTFDMVMNLSSSIKKFI